MALPRPQRDWALFLDFDGSIVKIVATPDRIEVDSALSVLLMRVREALGGASARTTILRFIPTLPGAVIDLRQAGTAWWTSP